MASGPDAAHSISWSGPFDVISKWIATRAVPRVRPI
jgi:hypothetical protein